VSAIEPTEADIVENAADPLPGRPRPTPRLTRPLLAACATTAAVTILSYALPPEHAATGVGLAFLAATYWLALANDPDGARRFGLSLGGLLDPEPIRSRRLLRDGAVAVGWILALAAITFPPFWVGYVWWWAPRLEFSASGALPSLDEALGQVLVIALPEEAFYRGYLQTAFDEARPPRWHVLGARLGPGVLIASLLFALGHLATEPHPNRLAVFFPALLFGFLRARTGGIGVAVGYHAACNVFASFLARGYGFPS
jgi:membrane protease YdiL (CAAX protease family)